MIPYLETGGSNGSLPKTFCSNGSLLRNVCCQWFSSSNCWFQWFFTQKTIIPMVPYLETCGSNGSLLRNWWFLRFSSSNWWFQCFFILLKLVVPMTSLRNWSFKWFPSQKRVVEITPSIKLVVPMGFHLDTDHSIEWFPFRNWWFQWSPS